MIIGLQKQWQYLTQLVKLDKIPHALLFCGQEKVGKKTTAIEFAKWLLKEDIEKKQHPDFIFISPSNKEIKISQVRDCIWRLSLRPQVSFLKVAIVDQAHCLNEEAQSSFLKTLEEPKGKTLLILITEYPESLFPTILSRVQKIKFYPPSKKEIKDYLQKKGVGEKEQREMIKLSLARPGKIIDFLLNPEKLERQKKAISDFVELSQTDLVSRFKYAKDLLAANQNVKEILEIWMGYLREILISESLTLKYSFAKLKNNTQ